jgi:hypothetical protein
MQLVDCTGRLFAPGKKGKISAETPKALDALGLNPNHWAHKVKGFGSGFGAKWFRFVAEVEDFTDKMTELKKRSLFRALKTISWPRACFDCEIWASRSFASTAKSAFFRCCWTRT